MAQGFDWAKAPDAAKRREPPAARPREVTPRQTFDVTALALIRPIRESRFAIICPCARGRIMANGVLVTFF